MMESVRTSTLTVKSVPVRAFSGRPPSEGGLNRGSRHVPVHAESGSILAFGKSFLVANERSIRRSRSVNRRFPARLPKYFVATEKCEMHARVAGRLNVRALLAGPIFIMADRKKYFVICQQVAVDDPYRLRWCRKHCSHSPPTSESWDTLR